MTRRQTLLAVITLLSLPLWAWPVAGQESEPGAQTYGAQVFGDIGARTDGDPVLLEQPTLYRSMTHVSAGGRFWNHGSPAKTGEYQDLNPSPFWDLDGLSSDGDQTLNFTAPATDKETTVGKLKLLPAGNFRPMSTMTAYIHRRDHDPLEQHGQPDPGCSPAPADRPEVIKQDLNVGQDYAVRVQELKASFKGNLTDNIKARLDVWGMQKDGTRQANAVAMCYNGPNHHGPTIPSRPTILAPGQPLGPLGAKRCHVLSQLQQIDWITTEIKPVIEARLGDFITIEYSRPMRGFTAADQTATRFYDRDRNLYLQ